MPFAVVSAFLYPISVFAFVIPGKIGFWSTNFVTVLVICILLFTERKTNRINATWGEGARGEFRVGEELDKLHKDAATLFQKVVGFYRFVDQVWRAFL